MPSMFHDDAPAYTQFLRANIQLVGKMGVQPFNAKDLWETHEEHITARYEKLAAGGGNHVVVTGALMTLAAELQEYELDQGGTAPTNPEWLKKNPNWKSPRAAAAAKANQREAAAELVATDAPRARYFYVAHGKITHEITHENPLAHARLSASSSGRWLGCPASPKMEDRYPDSSSAAAEEGTAAHRICELCLSKGKDASEYVGYWVDPKTEKLHKKDNGGCYEVTVEMADYVQMYVDAINEREYDEFMVETRVDFSRWVPKNSGILICYFHGEGADYEKENVPEEIIGALHQELIELGVTDVFAYRWRAEGFGTSDFIGIHGTTCYVDDFKYGKGVWVDAEGNTQMRLYGGGVYSMFDIFYGIEKFVFTIHQPRLGNIDSWEVPTEDLLEWLENTVAPGTAACLEEKPPFNPGDPCNYFCKAVGDCKAAAEHNLNIVGDELAFAEADEETGGMTALEYVEETGELPVKDPDALDNDQLGRLLQQVDGIIKWCKAIEARVTDELNRGEPVPGYKLVEGRSTRVWKDEHVAEKFLLSACGLPEDKVFTKKMISGPAAEKILGKKHPKYETLQGMMDKPDGKPVVAPESDKRPALAARVEEELDL